jgi:uncharacterized protein
MTNAVDSPDGSRLRLAGPERLSAAEGRVLGCLIEKQRTTPDAYPLSLNSLRLACNQSTNRHPVVDYGEREIREALHRLERRGLVRLASSAGSRAAKYRHLLEQVLPMRDSEQALMCVLLLRGAQTPGELKQRTERMHTFADLAALTQALQALAEGGLVQRLTRVPGQKEDRFRELLQEPPGEDSVQAMAPGEASEGSFDRAPTAAEWRQLLERVERLEREIEQLRGAREQAGSLSG